MITNRLGTLSPLAATSPPPATPAETRYLPPRSAMRLRTSPSADLYPASSLMSMTDTENAGGFILGVQSLHDASSSDKAGGKNQSSLQHILHILPPKLPP